jgi:hypothetical protein
MHFIFFFNALYSGISVIKTSFASVFLCKLQMKLPRGCECSKYGSTYFFSLITSHTKNVQGRKIVLKATYLVRSLKMVNVKYHY